MEEREEGREYDDLLETLKGHNWFSCLYTAPSEVTLADFSEVIDRLHEEYRKDSNIFDDRKFEMVEDESIDGDYVKVDRKTVKTALQAYKG